MECMVDGKEGALYVGESARSGNERMGEHLADAVCGRKDSHIHKHWEKSHLGRRTKFNFKILNFFNSALERQVGEAVRIIRTGAERILNARGEFNRCCLPIITTKEEAEVQTLGEKEDADGYGEGPAGAPGDEDDEAPLMSKKEMRLMKMKDQLRWGHENEDEGANDDDDLDDEVFEEEQSSLSILSEGDDPLIESLMMLLQSNNEVRNEAEKE